MTGDELLDAMEHIDDDLIEAAHEPVQKKRKGHYWVAAVIALTIVVTAAFLITKQPLAEPTYPKMVAFPTSDRYNNYEAYLLEHSEWLNGQAIQYNQPDGYANSLTDFFQSSIAQFLQGEENLTYSPLNVYMSMAMLAETTGGNSRQQILELFGLQTIEQLREQASHVWNAHYSNDGQTTLLLANSLWLDNGYTFQRKTAEILAERYYASSYSGNLGSQRMNVQLQNWLNTNTGSQAEEQAQNVLFNPDAVFALVSTVYFNAAWEKTFNTKDTKDTVFHAPSKDIMTPFMKKAYKNQIYYWGDNYSAISLNLKGNNKMWLILPDEDCSISETLESGDYLYMTLSPDNWKNQKSSSINLSLPKFDIVSQRDLIERVTALGVTDIFDSSISDFSPITKSSNLSVTQINHAVRVSIDETGCVATAFNVVEVSKGSLTNISNAIDFVLDRPFIFIISSRDNLPLFAGVVNEP